MGTNYYFRPKGFNEIDDLNSSIDFIIKILKRFYLDKLNDILDKYKENYLDLLCLDNISDLEDKVKFTVLSLDTPDIHICKISAGWIPLFESNPHYSNFEEFESFYEKNKDKLDLIDEYNRVIDFDYFKRNVFDRINNKNYETHLQYNNSYDISYYKDELGVEWTNSKFE